MAYNLLDIQGRVRNKIKDPSYSAIIINGFIYDAIVEIADLYIWPYYQKIIAGDLTIGEYTYEQQDDHQTTDRLVLIDPDNSPAFRDITDNYQSSDTFFDSFPAPDTRDNGQPFFWTEYGNQMYFHCPADKTYSLRQFYTKIPAELTSGTSVPELPINFREAIVLGASYRCEEERDNYDIAAILQNHFNDRIGDIINRYANNTLAGPDTIVTVGGRRDIE